jgi:hypothetical protein
MRIYTPVATGNGVCIIHTALEAHLPHYHLRGYHPLWTFLLPVIEGIETVIRYHKAIEIRRQSHHSKALHCLA